MTESMEIGNSIQPLRNVAAMAELIKKLENRKHGLPGMGIFYGPPGYGKTMAAIYAASALDAIHISVQELWTRKTLLQQVLRELGAVPQKTLAEMMMQANEQLAIAARPLIIDEADYAIQRGLIQIIRDFHDGSDVPVILVGMEKLPQKLRTWELIDSRVMTWTAAQPANLKDAQYLASFYAADVTIHDDMLQHILDRNTGNVRRSVIDLNYVQEQCKVMGLKDMGLEDWGQMRFPRDEAPAPRVGLK
jgi:DNA transposition AAA+ family ATPase